MSYLNDISIIITPDDLEEIHLKFYPSMKQKYMFIFGDIALWFNDYADWEKFVNGVQNEHEKNLIRMSAKEKVLAGAK